MFNAKFVFTVSIMAMMAVGAVNAATVTTTATVGAGAISGTTGTAGDVYDWSKWPGYKTEGIAGVTYVNKAVDAAGNAAQWAENHAAAAGTSAKNAADSATSANTAAENAADSAAAANESLKTAVKVTTAGTAVGSATKPVYVDANGKVQPITSYSGNAASATKATRDGNGEVIAETYATKVDLNTVSTTAGNAVVANPAITGGTGTKITYDSKGLVTGSTSLAESDIPTLTIGKIADLQKSLDDKQATLTTSNIKGAGSVSVGISNGVITVTGTDTNTTYSTGTATTSGLTKLYAGTGTNTDGTMTQAALNTALSGKLASVSTTGTGTVVKSIAKDGTEVKGTLGSIESEDITDGAIKDVDIADDANIAASKIDGLATVATSGSYDSLTNKPTIGTSALTIKNGATNTNIATFGANATAAVTATIPAATSTVAGLAKYGVIPSGSETSTTYATIWVE